jgi:hypothetical protein
MGWHSRLDSDPAWSVVGLRALLPSFVAQVRKDGLLEWQGWHDRDGEAAILSYWAQETVTLRPSPLTEALIWIYWKDAILCSALAEEFCHEDGSYRPYWFPLLVLAKRVSGCDMRPHDMSANESHKSVQTKITTSADEILK